MSSNAVSFKAIKFLITAGVFPLCFSVRNIHILDMNIPFKLETFMSLNILEPVLFDLFIDNNDPLQGSKNERYLRAICGSIIAYTANIASSLSQNNSNTQWLWFIAYTIWNIWFSRQMSGIVQSYIHNIFPYWFMLGLSNSKINFSNFEIFCMFRAILLSNVILQQLLTPGLLEFHKLH